MNKKEKIIKILAIVFAAQIVLILLFTIFSSNKLTIRTIEKKLLSGFNKDNVVSLEVTDAKETFTVEKKDKAWIIKRADGKIIPGETSKINSYLNTLDTLNAGIVRDKGPNEANNKIYGFDKDSVQKVTAKLKNNKLFTVYIGNGAKQKGVSYVKYNDGKIREVKSSISTETGNQPIKWAKREMLENVAVEDIAACDINSTLPWFFGKYLLKKNPDKSQDAKDKDSFVFEPAITGNLVPFAAENIVRNFVFLRVAEYKFDVDLSKKEKKGTIDVNLNNGKTYKYNIFQADRGEVGDYIITTDYNSYNYLVSEADLKRVIKPRDELFEKKQ